MKREPPHQNNGGAEEKAAPPPPGTHVLREPKQTRRLGLKFIAAAAAVLAVGAAVGLFLFLTQDSGKQHTAQPSPEQGLACPYLQRAAEAYERGDTVAFNATTERAVKIAESTLQQSGRTFGEAERIALELGLGHPKNAQELLRKAETVCSQLGRWDSPVLESQMAATQLHLGSEQTSLTNLAPRLAARPGTRLVKPRTPGGHDRTE
jgi:hypothetical protein